MRELPGRRVPCVGALGAALRMQSVRASDLLPWSRIFLRGGAHALTAVRPARALRIQMKILTSCSRARRGMKIKFSLECLRSRALQIFSLSRRPKRSASARSRCYRASGARLARSCAIAASGTIHGCMCPCCWMRQERCRGQMAMRGGIVSSRRLGGPRRWPYSSQPARCTAGA